MTPTYLTHVWVSMFSHGNRNAKRIRYLGGIVNNYSGVRRIMISVFFSIDNLSFVCLSPKMIIGQNNKYCYIRNITDGTGDKD